MQSQRHEEDSTNQMDIHPHFSQPSRPGMGLGGSAEGGANISLMDTQNLLFCPCPLLSNEQEFIACNDISFANGMIVAPINDEAVIPKVLHGFQRSAGELPFGDGSLAVTPSSTLGGNFLQHERLVNPSQEFSGQLFQYPKLVTGQDVMMPMPTSEINISSAGFLNDGPFMASTGMLVVQQPISYCSQGNGMGDMMLNPVFAVDHGAVTNGSAQCPAMDFTDDMLEDIPIMANSGAVNGTFSQKTLSPAAAPAPVPTTAAQPTNSRIPCTFCMQTFARDPDRIRHENSKHLYTPGQFLCHVVGCPKSQGEGYCHKDKLTEHLHKKHAGLGYVKRV